MNIPFEKIEAAIEENTFGFGNIGFCLACGEEADECEPDAEKYLCDNCGAKEVYGAEEIVMMGRVK
jgi:hypothetical protein